MKNQQKKHLIKKRPMLMLSLAVFILIIAGGYFYYRYEKKIIRKEQYSNLMTIADLKINQILHWREERLADAHVIAESPFIRQNFQRWLISQDSTLGKDLLERFALLRYNYKYEDVIIVSDWGKLLLGLNTNSRHIDSETIDYCNKALQDKKAFLSDFYFSPAHDTIHIDVFAPILNERNVPVAVLVLRVNPYDYLYPLIQSWPTSSKSAETYIIRKDGDNVLYENELRHISNTALKLRIPLTRIEVAAVQAVLGHVGIFEGIDYRGVRVLTDIRPVPGTPWFMIAKVDKSEIFSELKYRTVIIIIITPLLLLFFGIGLSWLYNIRQKNIYKKLLETGTALQESERKFRDTIKFLDQGYYSCMMDGVVLEHNRAFNRILGIDISKDLKGAKLPDFWLNTDDRKVYLQELLTMGFIRNYIIDAKTVRGEKVVVMVNSHLVKDEQGKPVRIEGTFTDFTRLRLTEEALKRSETKYRMLFENAQVGMYRSRIDGSAFLDVNNKLAEMFGFTREELLGTEGRIRWADPEDRDKMMRLIKEQGGILNNFEARVLTRSGEVRDIIASIEFHPDEGYLDGTMVDITERKEADKKIKDNEEKFRSLFEKNPLGIAYNEMIFDPSGKPIDYRFLEVNEAYIKIIGLDPQGKKVTEAFPGIEKYSFDWIGTFGHVAQTGEQIYFQQFFESDNRWYDCVAYQSKKNQYAVVFQDITERKLAEEQLRKLNRIYSLLSDINQAIVRTHEPKELFEKICKISVEQGGFGMAWIGLIDESSQKLGVIAQAGRTNGYHEQVNISLKGKPLTYCPIDSALRQGKHNICKIIENEEMAPCQKIAYDLGFRSSASFPLKVSDILKGALTFYSDKPDFFDEAELKLLDELALDISFSMEYAEKEDERKRAEESLKASEKRFRITAGSLIDVVYEWDLKEKIEWFGDIDGIMGYPENGFPRTLAGWAAKLHPEDTEKVMATIEGHLKKSKPYISEYRVMNKEGEWRWWTARGTALRDEQNIPYWWIGSITDITERKLVEETLRESEARYKTLVENIPQKIFMKDRDFRFISINENFARDLGISPEEIVGKVDYDFFSRKLADKYRADDVRIIKTGKTEELEEMYVVAGKETWVNTIKTPVRDKNDEIIGVLGVFWDITGRKLAEEEIRKLNTELEKRVVLRTAQLEATNTELEAFSYSVSHDLRAPLRHVSGYVELLNKRFQSDLPEKGQHYLRSISDSVSVMGALIDDLLQFSRAGRMEIRQSDFDMNEIVMEVIESLHKDNPNRKIEWVQEKLPSINGDEAMLRIVWTNLLSNAVKFTRTRKKARIEIGFTKEKKELVFFVRDNGVGFDMKYAQKLFGVFQRLHPTEEFEGTGIGLANVQRIVLRHGGRTWAEAEIDKGAVFYFSIPNK